MEWHLRAARQRCETADPSWTLRSRGDRSPRGGRRGWSRLSLSSRRVRERAAQERDRAAGREQRRGDSDTHARPHGPTVTSRVASTR